MPLPTQIILGNYRNVTSPSSPGTQHFKGAFDQTEGQITKFYQINCVQGYKIPNAESFKGCGTVSFQFLSLGQISVKTFFVQYQLYKTKVVKNKICLI